MAAKKKVYVPDRGDLVWLSFDPRVGREQSGERPALVISTRAFAEAVGYAVICPITRTVRQSPFEVVISGGAIAGAVLCSQVESVDFLARRMRSAGEASDEVVFEVTWKIAAIIGAEPE
jgi:mRNA interferase MazF